MLNSTSIPIAWKQVTATIVLGIDRAGSQPVKTSGLAGELIAALPDEDSIARQLDAAGCLAVLTRAGASFEHSSVESLPCSDCKLRQPTLAASQLLASVLKLGLPELLAEWCCLGAAAGIRIADELLPQVLHRLADNPDGVYVPFVLQTLGNRGRWLAEQNPTWKAVLEVLNDPESTLENGFTSEQVRALRLVRLKNTGRAREILQSWFDGIAEERTRLITVLEQGLSGADETFLESLLDDKAAGVRRAAAELLARLPQSAYVRRMVDRISMLVTIRRSGAKLLRKGRLTLVVDFPEPGDKELTRNAVEFKVKGKLGTKAHALSQMIGVVPLRHWTDPANATPGELVGAATNTEWSEPLLLGWTIASIRQRDVVWARAVIFEYFRQQVVEATDEANQWLPQLVGVLEPANREQVAGDLLAKAGAWNGPFLVRFLESCDQHWSQRFSETVLTSLRRHIAKTRGTFNESLRRLIDQRFAFSFHPGLADEFAGGWPTDADWWPRWLAEVIDKVARILGIRKDMHQELTK